MFLNVAGPTRQGGLGHHPETRFGLLSPQRSAWPASVRLPARTEHRMDCIETVIMAIDLLLRSSRPGVWRYRLTSRWLLVNRSAWWCRARG